MHFRGTSLTVKVEEHHGYPVTLVGIIQEATVEVSCVATC